jgi:hypothetical protein
VDLPIETDTISHPSRTRIELSKLRSGFEQPSRKRLGTILLRQFGAPHDFVIKIDGVQLTPAWVAVVERVTWVTADPRDLGERGIVLRVGERAIRPTFFLKEVVMQSLRTAPPTKNCAIKLLLRSNPQNIDPFGRERVRRCSIALSDLLFRGVRMAIN